MYRYIRIYNDERELLLFVFTTMKGNYCNSSFSISNCGKTKFSFDHQGILINRTFYLSRANIGLVRLKYRSRYS